ncbi:MAG: N-acetylmuramoyl-L-alanine amidase [Candidatus Omnitrophica bacterium]|nr:N-acetylmuramoyl-L-alanine amidase [Candidatus Omnitrophota bacterium]
METACTFKNSQNCFYVFFLIAAPLLLSSCVVIRTAPKIEQPPSAVKSPARPSAKPEIRSAARPSAASRGFRTHIVAPGETLWRISKIYDVPLASIMSTNRVKGDQDLQLGQTLNIPSAKEPEQIITLYPSHKWKYIVVHHSATDEGSSLQFHSYHQNKGWDSVGYHFVIDNGKSGKPDGFIEITPRWLQQLDGAHCKASEMNTKAIGICLVGDFNKSEPTKAQKDSLAFLVKKLQRYYKIHAHKILGHKQVPGSNTECPGKNFPWSWFKKQL